MRRKDFLGRGLGVALLPLLGKLPNEAEAVDIKPAEVARNPHSVSYASAASASSIWIGERIC